jgi:SpoVK/Ycf46/Vps4 family AAA+-type ATPase
LETNYLLQRLENYQGIVLITTNAAQYIDNAFQRRMDVVVNFVPPQAQERMDVWRLHLPAAGAPDDAYLAELSQRFVMTGGQIRNAALQATMLAVADNHGAVLPRHIELAILSEYQKTGVLGPSADEDYGAPSITPLDALLRALG